MAEKFRYQSCYAFLTYKTHLNKKEYQDWLLPTFGVYTDLLIGHEVGETGYEHTHVYIKFGKTISSRKETVFDYKGIHPNIQKVGRGSGRVSAKDIKAIKLYVSKSDPELAQWREEFLEDEKHWTEKVWECKTVSEVLSVTAKPSDAMGMITAFKYRPRVKVEMTIEMKEWQKECVKWIEEPENRRRVYWIYDEVGGAGKSQFCEWAYFNKGALVIKGVGGYKDGPTIIKNAIDKGWDQKILLIDLPRGSERSDGIYSLIEQVKDGFITALKYESESITLDAKPHVIVFSNWVPHVNQLSIDRWRIYELCEDLITLRDPRELVRALALPSGALPHSRINQDNAPMINNYHD